MQITTPPNDQNEKIVALQKTFEAAIQAQVKKAGVAKRGALTKEADRRVKVMYEKADSDQNGKIDFAGLYWCHHHLFRHYYVLLSIRINVPYSYFQNTKLC